MNKTMLLYMGGTFGCYGEPLTPMPAEIFLKKMHQLEALSKYDFDNQAAPYILDSSALHASHWLDVIDHIHGLHQQGYTDFILIHGTDTLSYASALFKRFLQPNIRLILTGSQLPLFDTQGNNLRTESDALDNLKFAFSSFQHIQTGVYVAFGGKLLDGSSVIKQHTHAWDAFNTQYTSSLKKDKDLCRSPKINITSTTKSKAAKFQFLCLNLCPQPSEMLAHTLSQFTAAPPHVLVLNAFGSGNLAADQSLIECIQHLSKQCLCVLSTQVPFGQLSQDYAVSDWILKSGLVRNNTQSHADLYAKCLELYLQYDTPAEWYQHWSIED